mgnify:CR=1 FL=1
MINKETNMTFEEAVEIVKAYSASGNLLDGLEGIQQELNEADEDGFYLWVSPREVAAYRLVCREMRPLFV